MKTASRLLRALAIVSAALLALVTLALAHGTPELTVKQTSVGPGGTITLSGDGLGEDGETVTISLHGPSYQAALGTVTLKHDSFDDTDFIVPKDAPAGAYVVTAKNGGTTASAQIEVTPGAASTGATASTAAAPVMTRTRSPSEWILSLGLLAITLSIAVALLWRHRLELTAVDR